jgi:hypothetical protein
MNKKEIIAGYAWPGQWKAKGQSIWPKWWLTDDDEDYAQQIANSPAEEIILEPNITYTLKITYPLSNVYKKKFTTGENGMSRQDFVDMCCEAYHEIYENEEKYGVWGHYIEDLTIHTLFIDKNNNITLGVDS